MNEWVGEPVCPTCEQRQARQALLRRVDLFTCSLCLYLVGAVGVGLILGTWLIFLGLCLSMTFGLSEGVSLGLAGVLSLIFLQALRALGHPRERG